MIIGIYGKSGSGKSTVCEYLSKKGFFVIDCDKTGHDILKIGKEGYNKVTEEFGDIINPKTKKIDRKKLGKAVFSDKDKLKKLNAITLPLIEKEGFALLEREKTRDIIIDGAHLYSSPAIMEKCDFFILVKSDNCIQRIIKRDGILKEDAKNRLSSQKEPDFFDEVIVNNSSLEELYKRTDDLIAERKKKHEGKSF